MSKPKSTMLSECRKFFPGCSLEQAHDLMWNATAYPFVPVEAIRARLKDLSHLSDRNPDKALSIAYAEYEKACADMRSKGAARS